MRILYHIPYPEGIGDDRTIFEGFRYAFLGLGHEFSAVTERGDLARTLEDTKPDLFFTTLNTIDPLKNAPVLKRFRENGGVVLMKAGWIEPHATAVSELIKNDMLSDIYTTELDVPHWKTLTGKELKMLPLAASKQYHFPAPPAAKYACDILYIGANLPKKREYFRRRLLPLKKKYRVKIFGPGWDPVDTCILRPLAKLERKITGTGAVGTLRIARQVPYAEENRAYASAKISLNFHEIQPDGSWLLNGRTFKIPACGGFEICDNVPLVRRFFAEDELVIAESDEDFFKKVDYYMAHEAERKAVQEKGTARALRDHTYHNRVETILGWYEAVIKERAALRSAARVG